MDPNDEALKVRVGKSVELSCEATSFPPHKIAIAKGNETLSIISPYELRNVSISDAGVYSCTAENDIGSAQKVFYLNVVDVPKILQPFENITLLTNETKKVVCEANGIPIPNILWKYDDEIISSNERILKLNSTLRSGKISCVAENTEGIDEKTFFLKVINEPKILSNADELQRSISVRENDDLELLCPFENFNDIEWTFNDQRLSNNFEYKIIDKKLMIYNTNRYQHGNWTCHVKNVAGNGTFTYEINILASPIVYASWNLNNRISEFLYTQSDIDERTFQLGDELILNCTAEAIPKAKVTWRKSSDIIGEGDLLTIENLQFHHR
jgi:hypothetical protein